MSFFFIVTSLDTLGKVMVAFTALRVHHRVLIDRQLDKKVFIEIRHEQIIGIFGVLFILVAYGMKLFDHYV